MRVRLISGIVAVLLLIPAAASADGDAGICYADPLAEVCIDDKVHEKDDAVVVPVSDRDEVEAAQVLGVSQELAVTGIDTSALLLMALGLLAVGGLAIRSVSRRQGETSTH